MTQNQGGGDRWMDPWGSEVRQSSVAGEFRPVREPVSMRGTAFLKMTLKCDTHKQDRVW